MQFLNTVKVPPRRGTPSRKALVKCQQLLSTSPYMPTTSRHLALHAKPTGASARAGARATERRLPSGVDMRTCDGKGARAIDQHQRNIARHGSAQRPRHIFHKPPPPLPPLSPPPAPAHTKACVRARARAHISALARPRKVEEEHAGARRQVCRLVGKGSTQVRGPMGG